MASIVRITRARLITIISLTVILSLLTGSLVTLGVTKSAGEGRGPSVTVTSTQTSPYIDGTWVSQAELNRPFTLNNGVITTSEVEDEPARGIYTISNEPDANGYYILELWFDGMDDCTSDTSDTLDECQDRSFDITRFEIQPAAGTDSSYISSFSLRPVLSDEQKKKVSENEYYDSCAWSLGYNWYNGGYRGNCAIDSSTFEPVKPDYWTMIRQ